MEKKVMAIKTQEIPEQKILKNKDPESKVYLLCISGKDGAEDSWEFITGRTELYETIKNSIEFIDLQTSFVVLEDHPLNTRKSIVSFMKYAERFYNDNFDIEDYIRGDWSESEYQTDNEIDSTFNMLGSDSRLSMTDFMNGNITTSSLEDDE